MNSSLELIKIFTLPQIEISLEYSRSEKMMKLLITNMLLITLVTVLFRLKKEVLKAASALTDAIFYISWTILRT